MKKYWTIFGLMVTLLVFLTAGCAGNSTNNNGSLNKQAAPNPQTVNVSAKSNSVALFETSKGNFRIELFEDKAPQTSKNFTTLVNKGFYDGLIFHRVIDDFMIQSGDPKGNGTGGSGYTIPDEFSRDLRHTEGVLSMANAGPNTGGSQFFITLKATPWLDDKHAVFGKVIEGMDVVRTIGKVKVNGQDKPIENVVIKKITIEKAK
ncbi:MAG: peptidylprolyl isomerase [Negativicutes bacterium]|nr:peptidylprolyl isomerase [Negativicutes bacterium]